MFIPYSIGQEVYYPGRHTDSVNLGMIEQIIIDEKITAKVKSGPGEMVSDFYLDITEIYPTKKECLDGLRKMMTDRIENKLLKY